MFFSPSLDSVVCPSGAYPPLLLARRPNRGHIGGGGWTPSFGFLYVYVSVQAQHATMHNYCCYCRSPIAALPRLPVHDTCCHLMRQHLGTTRTQ
ncbi:unnamed protein product [Ectocarpus sp. 8 AP-2014]